MWRKLKDVDHPNLVCAAFIGWSGDRNNMHLFLAVKTTKCKVYPHYYCSSIGKIPLFELNVHICICCLFQCFVCIHFLFGKKKKKKKTYFINPLGKLLGKTLLLLKVIYWCASSTYAIIISSNSKLLKWLPFVTFSTYVWSAVVYCLSQPPQRCVQIDKGY